MLTVSYEKKPLYDIYIEDNYDNLKAAINTIENVSNKKVCIVTETNVAPLYLEAVKDIVKDIFKSVTEFVFHAGEAYKNLDTVEDLYECLILNHFERGDMLIALGGGVTGDLTGYAAATYLRGISFIQMPTTLLSQVDSSIGGKTGVDFKAYKNMVGAFHQPALVYMNLSTLNTLTDKQFCEGLGEIIKHSLIKDSKYYEWLINNMDLIIKRDINICREMIEISCNIKRLVVENDPKEKGERALLNFGHTLGHAIEKVSDFSLLHGECVSLGSVAASWISFKRGLITEKQYELIKETFKNAELPVNLPELDVLSAMEAIKHDKKMEAGNVKFILLNKPGEAFIDRSVTKEEMKEALLMIKGE